MTHKSTDYYPVLPLRDIVVFPNMSVPLFVGREKSIKALEAVMKSRNQIVLTSQKDPKVEDPGVDSVNRIGVLANIHQLLKLPDGTVKILTEGKRRVSVVSFMDTKDYLEADIVLLEDSVSDAMKTKALHKTVVREFGRYAKFKKTMAEEVVNKILKIEDPAAISDAIVVQLETEVKKKQSLLEMLDVTKRLEIVHEFMQAEIAVVRAERKIKSRVKTQMEKTQREYYLNEQKKAIEKELGETEETHNEIEELEKRVKEASLPKEALEKVESEIKKFKTMSTTSAEATVVRNYLDWILSIPWKNRRRVKKNINEAGRILDANHYGLEKVKERILEHLAVQKRSSKLKGSILCLVGPPGVGKTSLGKSVAKATGREFLRITLGGVRDEAEIRGHRKTYIGSMPGKIMQSMKKVKSVNPLILLDEIDKMGNDFRGDPASAMLEVLDPEQNDSFTDHYLEVEYDLSGVMFLCTANSYDMPGPLLDRMEIIQLVGYTEDEKIEIANRHILPKLVDTHGLKKGEFSIDNGALAEIIRTYTLEAGVRNLERELAKLCRKSVTRIEKGKAKSVKITEKSLQEFLGAKRFRYGLAEEKDQVGAVTGLAWTSSGGDLLFIEAVKLPGKGRIKTTGKLGDVMKESIEAASSFVKSISPNIGVKPPQFERTDIHVHVPQGATPKDGPSAGISMVTSIVSVLTGIPVRRDIAMTGEVTLRGNVLGIGGLKEKLLAALRGGVKTVIIPEENMKDLPEIPDNVKSGLTIIPVKTANEVLDLALTSKPSSIEWTKAEEMAYMGLATLDTKPPATPPH